MKIGLCISGELGFRCFVNLIETEEISFVLTDSHSSKIIDLANKAAISIFRGNPRNGKASTFVKSKDLACDLLLSINYLFIIEKDLIELPKKYALNIHGSLLPKYRGRTPHVWSIINGEDITGITAHLIDEECDEGPIALQKEIPIDPTDTGGDILNKFFEIYPGFVSELLSQVKNDSIRFENQDQSKASYFGKRTAEDGHINWNWDGNRIYNWVRAQAKPYPMAFAFFRGVKVLINRVSFEESKEKFECRNGMILSVDPNPKVKITNGVIELEEYYIEEQKLEKGGILE